VSALPDEPLFKRVKVQISHLDCIFGAAPLRSATTPEVTSTHLDGIWSVTGEPKSSQEWADDDAVRLEFDGSMSIGDPYSFHMGFSPVAVLSAAAPLPLDEWLTRWVTPLRRLVALATGRQQDVTYLAVEAAGDEDEERRGPAWLQVYGAGITQDPFASDLQSIRETRTVFTTAGDDISALSLLRDWQRLDRERHPLLQTYGGVIDVRPDHPRARFLLLVQALEGLHGHENREQTEAKQAEHLKLRQEVLANAQRVMDDADYRYLKANLPKRPPTNLDHALAGCLTGLPVDLSPSLEQTSLAQKVRAEQANKAPTTLSAIRVVRNDLAHGNRGYERAELTEVVVVLERVVRAHLLRLLRCPEPALVRALTD
jgi:ApeA N-terminal domain 1